MLFIIPGRYQTTWTILFSFFPALCFLESSGISEWSAPLLCLSLAHTCPELSTTTSCAGHFAYFRCPALRNNHRSEQACARCPPAMSQNSCAHPPTHTPSELVDGTPGRNGPSCFKGPLSSGVMLSIFASVKELLITSSSENCYVFTHFSVELWVTFRLVFKNSSSSGDVSRPL